MNGDANPVGYDRLYVGGQPSARDLKMLYEQGFSAVYSLWPFSTSGSGMEISDGIPMPTSAEAQAIAAEAGLLYKVIPLVASGSSACIPLDPVGNPEACLSTSSTRDQPCGGEGCTYIAPGEAIPANAPIDWTSPAAVDDHEQFIDFALRETNGPILIHDHYGRTSAAAAQLYRARKAMRGSIDVPSVVPLPSKSITQTAIIEAGEHGIDIRAWEETIAREAGESTQVIQASNGVSAETERPVGCLATDRDATCTGASEDGQDCSDAFTAASDKSLASCPAGCNYVEAESPGTTICTPHAGNTATAADSCATATTLPSCARTRGAGTCRFVPSTGDTPEVVERQPLAQYHWMKAIGSIDTPVGSTHLYVAGQVQAEHISAIYDAGVVSVVNFRKNSYNT